MLKTKQNITKRSPEALITIPLSAVRFISGYPKEKKILCEITTKELKRLNEPQTFDEMLNEARLDYALGNYKTVTSAKDLIASLRLCVI